MELLSVIVGLLLMIIFTIIIVIALYIFDK